MANKIKKFTKETKKQDLVLVIEKKTKKKLNWLQKLVIKSID